MKKNKSIKTIMATVIVLVIAIMVLACSNNYYKVTFNYNYDGAPAAATVEVERGKKCDKPNDPVREGYIFNGWYHNAEGTGVTYYFLFEVTSDTVLYAKWTEQTMFSVTFVANYEDAPYDGLLGQKYIERGNKVQPFETIPTRANHQFTEWYANSECTVEFDFDTEIKSNTVIYAGWSVS